jgi:hypothetical protein
VSKQTPKILLLDIETAPIIAHVWKLWDNNVGLNQIEKDWFILSWSAKWLDGKKVFYEDLRGKVKKRCDKSLLKGLWKLLDEADIVLHQNGKKFDIPKINARFVINGFKPTSHYRQLDLRDIVKKNFGFTSGKLEYITHTLNKKYKKQKHYKFAGHDLWTECLKDNLQAWREMEKYNKYDVLALEESYKILRAWDNTINFQVYHESNENKCDCGSFVVHKRGFRYTTVGKYQNYQCQTCGKNWQGKHNLLTNIKRRDLVK